MDELPHLQNATASHTEIADSSPASHPIPFPGPAFGACRRVNANVHNPMTSEDLVVPNVIYEIRPDGSPPERAYWIGRKLKKAIYGCVRACTILRVREPGGWAGPDGNSHWEITSGMAAVKIIDLKTVAKMRGQHMEDPLKEVAAMQFASAAGPSPEDTNVLDCLDLFQDEKYIYMFMPYCSSGELFGFVERNGRFAENVARFWFRQILNGLFNLQKKGICHRDLSLENILVDQNTRALVIDLGMCLRVPFNPPPNPPGYDGVGASSDVSANTMRRLICPQGQCGKPNYISPEVLQSTEPFDGFAIDIWASAIVLFIMLVGLPPFEWASNDDPRFRLITRGGLEQLIQQWQRPISPEAIDLLQSMLREDPAHRLSLFEIMHHPWVLDGDPGLRPNVRMDEGWRR